MVSKEMAQFELIGFETKLKKTQNSKGKDTIFHFQ